MEAALNTQRTHPRRGIQSHCEVRACAARRVVNVRAVGEAAALRASSGVFRRALVVWPGGSAGVIPGMYSVGGGAAWGKTRRKMKAFEQPIEK